MRGDEHGLARREVDGDVGLPVGQHPLDDVLQALGAGQVGVGEVGVAGVAHLRVLGVVGEHGRRHVERAAPELELLGAVLLERLGLVVALQRAVVALVEAPGALDVDPEAVGLLERDVGGLDGAGEHARCTARRAAGPDSASSSPARLASATPCSLQAHVDPSGEQVLLVPVAVAVAQQDEGVRRSHASNLSRCDTGDACPSDPSPAARRTRTGCAASTAGSRRCPSCARTADPLVVDLGYGASGVTALELHQRLREGAAGRRGGRPRDRARRGCARPPSSSPACGPDARASPGCARLVRARRVRGAAARRPAAGRDPRVQRAAAVRRGRGRRRLGAAWPRGSQPGGRARRGHLRRDRPGLQLGRRDAGRPRSLHDLPAARGARVAVDRRRAAAEGAHPPQRARRARPRAARRARPRLAAERAARRCTARRSAGSPPCGCWRMPAGPCAAASGAGGSAS